MKLNKPAKNFKKMKATRRGKQALLSDLETMQKDPSQFGLSRSQRDKQAQEAIDSAAQQGRAAAEKIATTGLGSGWQGQTAETARQTTKAKGLAGAAATAQGLEESNAVARAKVKETDAKLQAQMEREQRNRKFWSQQGINIAKAMAGGIAPFTPKGGKA